MNTQPFVSHRDLVNLIPAASCDHEDEIVEWLNGTSYYWVTPDETKSHNFKTLPQVIKDGIVALVKNNQLPERFAIFYEK